MAPATSPAPSDVAIASNGDVFIADGHNANGNNRVVKYNSRGEFLMTWGETGYAPGQFRALHAIAIRSGRSRVRGRSQQQPDPDLRPGRQPFRHLDAIRAPERNRV